jgi:alkylhydroperoxidase family enzyme
LPYFLVKSDASKQLKALVTAILEDWHTAPVNERMRAILGFLEKVTLRPTEVTAEDILPLKEVGINEQAVQEALYVCFLFNLMDRLADAFDFHLPTEKGYRIDGQLLYRIGYWVASVPG